MKSSRLAVMLVALVVGLATLFAGVPSASAAGVLVFRTDNLGNKTGTVISIGNTGSSAYCAGVGIGAIRYGVAVCYL